MNIYLRKLTLLFFVFLILILSNDALAQCAMCRGSLESSVSDGSTSIAAGINKGILYLLVMPYLIIGTLAYLWYKNSKQNRVKFQKLYQRLGRSK